MAFTRTPDAQYGPGQSDVIISAIGGNNPVTMQGYEIQATWEINQPSQLSTDISFADALRYWADPRSIKGQWIKWLGHPCGDWAGIITRVTPHRDQGVIALECHDFSYYMSKRYLPNSAKTIAGKPGAVAKTLVTVAQKDDYFWIDPNLFVWDETGDDYSVQLGGQQLLSTLVEMARASGQEFSVSTVGGFTWKKHLGKDLTASVQLNEGIEITSYTPDFDIADVVNDLEVQPRQQQYAQSYSRRVVDAASVAAIGRQQGFQVLPNGARPIVVKTMGTRMLQDSLHRGDTLTFDVTNVYNSFASFDEGDILRVVIPSMAYAENIRVLQRGLVLSQGILHVTGEVSSGW